MRQNAYFNMGVANGLNNIYIYQMVANKMEERISKMIRNCMFNILVMAVIFPAYPFFISNAVEPFPLIDIAETTHSFPTVYEGKMLSHDFLVFNRGGADLKIKKVSRQ